AAAGGDRPRRGDPGEPRIGRVRPHRQAAPRPRQRPRGRPARPTHPLRAAGAGGGGRAAERGRRSVDAAGGAEPDPQPEVAAGVRALITPTLFSRPPAPPPSPGEEGAPTLRC